MTTYNIYQRETLDQQPVQIASGLTSKNYSVLGLAVKKEFYFSVGAVKNGIEKISQEVRFLTDTPHSLISFNNSGVVNGTSLSTWYKVNMPSNVLEDGKYSAIINSTNQYLRTDSTNQLNNDWEFSIDIKVNNLADYNTFLESRNTSYRSGYLITIDKVGRMYVENASSSNIDYVSSPELSDIASFVGLYANYKFKKVGNTLSFYINDIYKCNVTLTYTPALFLNWSTIGWSKYTWDSRFTLRASIRQFRFRGL